MSQGRRSLQTLLPVICDLCSSLPPGAPLPAKVTVNYYEEEGSMPIDQAGLFLTAIGKLVGLWPACLCSPGAPGLFSVPRTWHSELPLNNAGPRRDAQVPSPFRTGLGGCPAGGGRPWPASNSPQCWHSQPGLCGPPRRKSKVCSSLASPLQPAEESASHSEGNGLSTKSALFLIIPATPGPPWTQPWKQRCLGP